MDFSNTKFFSSFPSVMEEKNREYRIGEIDLYRAESALLDAEFDVFAHCNN